jgi:hypothetical protein
MDKPKIIIDRKQATEAEANQYKNFDQLLKSHAAAKAMKFKMNLFKGFIGASVVAGIVALVVLNNDDAPAILHINQQDSLVKSDRPFPNIPVVYDTLIVNANERSVIKISSGTVITIEANTLVDSLGNTINGNVELRYREFRDMIDVFVAGIPMDYDSAGVKRHFESAGMFELLAVQNKNEVFIKNGKTITIDFASQFTEDKYNIYTYNPDDKKWTFISRDSSNMKVKMQQSIIAKPENAAIYKPQLANPKKQHIKLDIVESEFPEFAMYKNVLFQIDDKQSIDPSKDMAEWDDVRVDRKENGTYLLHFERGKEVKEFACSPVFASADYVQAKKVFDEEYKASQEIIKNKEKEKKALAKKFDDEQKSQVNSLNFFRNVGASASKNDVATSLINRQFSISKFGVYNSDCPSSLPQGALLAADFTDKKDVDKKSLKISKAYLVEKSKNALFTYYQVNTFSYNPASTNVMWALTEDNKLAVFSAADFKKLKVAGKGEKHKFEMNIVTVDFTSVAQIRKYLEF